MTANESLHAIPDSIPPRPVGPWSPERERLVTARVGKTQMLSVCVIPACGRLTMGGTCVDHDVPVSIVFPRGRPYVLPAEPVTV
jgi:hypothetical protein